MNEFSYKLKVFYEDTDSGGVVYYANYLKFFERARTEAIAEIGLSNKKLLEENGIFIIVKSCNIEYKKPCLLYTSPSPRDRQKSRMPSSA